MKEFYYSAMALITPVRATSYCGRFRFTTGIVRTAGKVCLAQMPRQVLVLLAFSNDGRMRLNCKSDFQIKSTRIQRLSSDDAEESLEIR